MAAKGTGFVALRIEIRHRPGQGVVHVALAQGAWARHDCFMPRGGRRCADGGFMVLGV
jgi:hypothetical protein